MSPPRRSRREPQNCCCPYATSCPWYHRRVQGSVPTPLVGAVPTDDAPWGRLSCSWRDPPASLCSRMFVQHRPPQWPGGHAAGLPLEGHPQAQAEAWLAHPTPAALWARPALTGAPHGPEAGTLSEGGELTRDAGVWRGPSRGGPSSLSPRHQNPTLTQARPLPGGLTHGPHNLALYASPLLTMMVPSCSLLRGSVGLPTCQPAASGTC